ncbi:BamA/TamA family outer membrane protein [Sulfurovum sp.]|uniref:BamA/TamA family outer membrane protein n=1 Tax=Sulfurovum sp. TaxID=1969726 RepID=UPI002867E66F|nr:BamA/TamA family outer membrane protein [Sulfurovum sp.]
MKIFKMPFLLLFLSAVIYASSEVNATKQTGFFNFDKKLFVSDEDGKFDVSDFLSTKYGFMPVPIIVTEPAVGYGGGLNLLFLHDSLASSIERKSPPSISGVVAAGTENGTRFGAAYHLGFWKEDTIRTTTAVGVMDVNMNFYLRNLGIDMNLKGYMAYQEVMFRIKESDFFLGGNYVYVDIESKRNDGDLPILNPLFEHEFKMGALAAVAQYDTRDTIFTPSKGVFAKATLRRFDENFGGNENFWRYGAKVFSFYPLSNKLILGVRVEGEAVNASDNERVPFMANPSINMRGIQAMRYQGEKMMLGEVQLRWEFIDRWNMVFFGGAGKVFGNEYKFKPGEGAVEENISFQDAPTHAAGGVGFRYELARKYGLWGGLDFATNEENEFAFYITIGSAWGAF